SRGSACGIDANMISLNYVVIAAAQQEAGAAIEVANRQSLNGAAAGFDNETSSTWKDKCSIELDQRRACVSRLACTVDNNRVGDFRKRLSQLDNLHSRSGNIEHDRIPADGAVSIQNGVAQRSRAVTVIVRHHKTLTAGGEVCCLRSAQIVEGLAWCWESETGA